MFTNIHIERFRGIPSLDLDGLRPINLVVGKNNTGKTSVLEAILLLCAPNNPFMPAYVGQIRGQRFGSADDADISWRSLFPDLSGKVPIIISGSLGEERLRLRIQPLESTNSIHDFNGQPPSAIESEAKYTIVGLKLDYDYMDGKVPKTSQITFNSLTHQLETPPSQKQSGDEVLAFFLSSRSMINLDRDTKTYSYLVRNRQEQKVLELIRLLDPRIQRLIVISESSGATVYVDIGGESLIPLAVCGEGMIRLFSIILAFTVAEDGVLLIDEIDNGLHYTVMNKIWPILHKLCSENSVQLIATTHNEEMLRGAIDAFQKDFKDFGLFRLDRTQKGIKAVSYNEEALQGLVETAWEVRG